MFHCALWLALCCTCNHTQQQSHGALNAPWSTALHEKPQVAGPQEAFSLSSPHGWPWLTAVPRRQTGGSKKMLHNYFTDKEHHIWNAVGINMLPCCKPKPGLITQTHCLWTRCAACCWLLDQLAVWFFFYMLVSIDLLAAVCAEKNKQKLWLVNTDVIFKPRSVTSAHTPTEHIL